MKIFKIFIPLVALTACVPSMTRPFSKLDGALSINSRGDIAYIMAGRAFLAKFPDYSPREIPSPANVSAISWHSNEPWLAIPATGQVIQTTNVPISLNLPAQPRLLSDSFIFTSDGDVFDYTGKRIGHLPNVPTSTLDQEKRTFVIARNIVFAIDDKGIARLRDVPEGEHSLVADGNGFELITGQAVKLNGLVYRLKSGKLEIIGGKSIETTAEKVFAAGEIVATIGNKIDIYQEKTLKLLKSISRLEEK